MTSLRLLVTALLTLIVAAPAHAQDRRVPASQNELRLSYAPIVQRVTPAVVNVYAAKVVQNRNPLLDDPVFRRFFGVPGQQPEKMQRSLGSGVMVDPSGLVVTNNHVIEGADQVKISLADKREFEAEIVLKDTRTDLAVLRVKNAKEKFATLDFSNSDDLQVGDVVLAVGNPFGVGQTVTAGIVSALGRTHLGINTFENFIQTDAAINPGNSGGALVDASGNLVGINSAIYSRTGGSQGIGFAIPVSIARKVMEQIIKSGSVTRGWVGVEVQDLSPELAESFSLKSAEGALIAGVLKGGPADVGGIRPGDILLAVNGRVVADSASLLNLIAALKPGEDAQLTVARKQQTLNLKIQVGRRPMQRTVESTQAPEPEIN